jgi:phosphate transport system substrate-binding protein
MIKRILGVLLTSLSLSTGAALAAESAGAGSTFVFPILEKWAAAYEAKTGDKIRYESIGSGAGISQIKAATVDFGASDMPLRTEELEKRGLGQFPLVIGGVVPVVNIDGVGPGGIRFSGPMLADIFLGKIKNWNNPAIRALNPDVNLPAAAISVIHRLDGSGTTFNWANYLSKVSPEWKQQVGEGTSIEWPTGAAEKAMKELPHLLRWQRTQLATWSMPTPSRTSWPTDWCRTGRDGSFNPALRRSRPPPRTPTGREQRISSLS